jgi:hypothetical protein
MALRTHSEILKALAQHAPEDIVGTAESTTIDFKQCLYPLDLPKGRFDLCLHVAAMANAAGGLIICGFKADKAPTEVHECASHIMKVPRALLDVPRHKDVLIANVWPLVDVGFEFFPHSPQDPDHGYLVIEVQALPEHERFATVRRFLNDDGKLVEGFVIPIRHGDQTTYPSAEELHHLMADAHRFRNLPTTLRHHPSPDAPTPTATLDEHLSDLLGTKMTWTEMLLPVLVWQSTPDQPTTLLEGMYERNGGVYGALDRPQILRESGFNFEILGNPPSIENGALVKSEPRRAIRIDPDGTVTAAALATEDMLGWASQRQGTTQPLNVIVLTEMTLEYFRLVDTHIKPRATGPWHHRIHAQRFQQPTTVTLGTGGGNVRFPFHGQVRPASFQQRNCTWTAIGDPERDAYEALNQIYALFGLPVSANPFVDGNRVSTEAFLTALAR